MNRLVFIDTETTSLRPDRRAWDIALIVREPGQPDEEHQWFVHTRELDLGNADPFALKIGHFYERHPSVLGHPDRDPWAEPSQLPEQHVLRQVERETRGAHLVGAVPNFDAEVLGARMREHGIAPSWHYHLIDVETLMVGKLAATGVSVALPWSSDELSQRFGVASPSGEDRHTALGDARWVRDLYDAVMGGTDG